MKPDQDNHSNPDAADITDGDEALVRQQMELLGQPEPIAPEFVESLSDRLDTEFAAVTAEAGATSGIESGTENDLNGFAIRRPATESIEPVASNGLKQTRILPRWLGGLIAATVLMGMLSFWMAQPLSTWAEMIDALNSTPWVQTDSGRTSSWFSASNQVVAMRDSKQTVFASQSSGAHLNYVREDARIYQTNSTQKWLPLERDLIAWLADGSGGSLNSDVNWSLVSESTRTIDDASGRWLELTVEFKSVRPMDRTFTAIFLLNPETKLPVSCRVHQGELASATATDGSRWQAVSFDYPNSGPANIFDLGVAVETPILLAGSDSKIGLIASDAKSTARVAALDKRSEKPNASIAPKPKSLDPPPKKVEPVVPEVSVPVSPAPVTPAVASSEGDLPAEVSELLPLPNAEVALITTIPIVPIPATSVA